MYRQMIGAFFQYMFDSMVFYVGQVVSVSGDKVTANFLQFISKDRDGERANFVNKSKIEEASVDQIVMKLGAPMLPSETSKRKCPYIKFSFDFSSYNLGY